MIYGLLLITLVCSALIDNVMSHDSFRRYGLYFSRDGWKTKYLLTEWLNKYLPLWLSRVIAQDILVIFSDLFHTAKTLMIASFIVAIFGFTWLAFLIWLAWSVLFNIVYYITK